MEPYRKILYTTPQIAFVVVDLKPGDKIDMGVLKHTTQFICVESGVVVVKTASRAEYDGDGDGGDGDGVITPQFKKHRLEEGDSITIPPEMLHVATAQKNGAKMYILYSSPKRRPATTIQNGDIAAFKNRIDKTTLQNTFYRKVIHTTPQMQLVVMSLKPGEKIDMEIHKHTTQFIRVVHGSVCAETTLPRSKMVHHHLKSGGGIIIPPDTLHMVTAQENGAKMYTIYSPPEHPPGTIQRRPPLSS